MVILVADVRPHQAIVALVDLNGRFLAREAVPLVSEPARSVTKIVQCMQSMRTAHSDRSFEGIGISMPGRVDPETQRLILAPNLKWSDYDIKGAMEEQMELQVELANAANACLLSELWSGRLDGIRNAVLITVSEGIGAAILANGQIITSRSGLAGEFGHSPIDPTGPVCGCGQRGCWEVFASSTAALRYYAELATKSPNTHRVTNIHDLLRLTEEGDPTAIAAITRQATHLGRGLRLVTASLAPEVVLDHRRPHHLMGSLRSDHPERDGRHHAGRRPSRARHHQRRRTLPPSWRSRRRPATSLRLPHLDSSGRLWQAKPSKGSREQIDCETRRFDIALSNSIKFATRTKCGKVATLTDLK